MQILHQKGTPDVAEIFVARLRSDPMTLVEFVDAVDPRCSREEKWVVTVSTQFGCPIRCLICDAGGFYRGNLTADEILAQIDYVVRRRCPDGRIINKKFKIHFARMGEPALNPGMLEVLERLPAQYDAPSLIPCIPTIAPASASGWFEKLLEIKHRLYGGGHFQLQFSINSTSPATRDKLMPAPKWDLGQLSNYGRRFFSDGDRKVVLNFALAKGVEVDPGVVSKVFSPDHFMVKLTPVNPTETAIKNGYQTRLSETSRENVRDLVGALEGFGFECVISIGDEREIEIGSNCGQAASQVLKREAEVEATLAV